MRPIIKVATLCTFVGLLSLSAYCQRSSPERPSSLQLRRGVLDNRDHPDLPERLEEIRRAARQELSQIMNAGPANQSPIEDRIRSSLKDEWGSAAVLRESFNGTEFTLAGYSVFHGSTAIPDATGVIEAFRKVGTGYEWTASTSGGALEGFTLRLDKLPSPWSTEIWILAHGQKTQVMQYHEKMAIYSFNGLEFKELWNAGAARRDASYKVVGDSLFVNYDDDADGKHTWLTQRLYLTPGGVVESTPQPGDLGWKISSGTFERADQ
jgi:hypothetical protein